MGDRGGQLPRYLDLNSDIQERDRIGLKLAECYWELEDYVERRRGPPGGQQQYHQRGSGFSGPAAAGRVHVRMGDFEVAEPAPGRTAGPGGDLLAQGEVLLVEAESLVAQGQGDEASPLLENMPAEWETPVVKARAADMLGYLYLERGEWEEARNQFQTALLKRMSWTTRTAPGASTTI